MSFKNITNKDRFNQVLNKAARKGKDKRLDPVRPERTERTDDGSEVRDIGAATKPCQCHLTGGPTNTWLDPKPNCGSGGTVVVRGSVTNPQGQMRPIFAGGSPYLGAVAYIGAGDRVHVQIKNISPEASQTRIASYGNLSAELGLPPEMMSSVRVDGVAPKQDGLPHMFSLGELGGAGSIISLDFEVPINFSGYTTSYFEIEGEDLGGGDQPGCIEHGFYHYSQSGSFEGQGCMCPDGQVGLDSCHVCDRRGGSWRFVIQS